MMGGKLDEATAKKFGLEKAAFQQALQKAMLIQFAKDNGLYITDEDLAEYLISIPAFQENGKFSDKLYKIFLQNSRMTATEFETNLKKDMLVEKVLKAITLKPTKTTDDTIASFLFMEDKIKIKTIQAPMVEVSEDEIKKYWEANKDKYKSPLSYNIGYFYVAFDTNVSDAEISNYYDEHKDKYTNEKGEIEPLEKVKDEVKKDVMAKKTKKEAIITMKKLKNDEMKFNEAKNVSLDNQYVSKENMQKLVQNKFLKPTFTPKGWLIATLISVNEPKVLPYDKAKDLAKADLIKEKTKESLIKLAKENINFTDGKNIGFIGRDDVMKLKNMSIDEANRFISFLFNSQKNRGFVILPTIDNPQKAVLFNITEQKLLDKNKYTKYQTMVSSFSNKLKNNELNKNLIKQLQKLYEAQIKLYMKI